MNETQFMQTLDCIRIRKSKKVTLKHLQSKLDNLRPEINSGDRLIDYLRTSWYCIGSIAVCLNVLEQYKNLSKNCSQAIIEFVAFDLNEFDKANELLRELYPHGTHHWFSEVYLKLGRKEEAFRCFLKTKQEAEDEIDYILLAETAWDLNKYKEANTLLWEAFNKCEYDSHWLYLQPLGREKDFWYQKSLIQAAFDKCLKNKSSLEYYYPLIEYAFSYFKNEKLGRELVTESLSLKGTASGFICLFDKVAQFEPNAKILRQIIKLALVQIGPLNSGNLEKDLTGCDFTSNQNSLTRVGLKVIEGLKDYSLSEELRNKGAEIPSADQIQALLNLKSKDSRLLVDNPRTLEWYSLEKVIAVNCSHAARASQGYQLTTDLLGEDSAVLPFANLRKNFNVRFYLNEFENLPQILASGEPMLLTCIASMFDPNNEVVCVDASPL
ncbi:MAG: hypothetical protein QNL04_05365 [SAR324 cluster bacterium]|nr:hypothetical protein [SAR324 cluster bacterium]